MKYHSDSEHLQVVSSPYPFLACRTHISIFHFTSPFAFFQPQLPIFSSCHLPHSANDHCFSCSGQRDLGKLCLTSTVLPLPSKYICYPATSSHLPFTSGASCIRWILRWPPAGLPCSSLHLPLHRHPIIQSVLRTETRAIFF